MPDRPLDQNTRPISVVVPFRDSHDCIINCLKSLQSLDYPPDKLEIIAVDDSRDDTISPKIKALFPTVHLIDSSQRGINASRRTGIDASTHDIVAFTDADCIVPASWARVIAKTLDAGVDAVTGPVRHSQSLLAELIGVTDFGDFQSTKAHITSNFPGCNYALRKTTLNELECEKEKQTQYGSDRLISWRLHCRGMKILYNPDMEIHHTPDVDLSNLLERRLRYGRKALELRRIDPTLPGSAITRLWLLAIPAYILWKFTKDTYRITNMAAQNQLNPWHTPLLIPAALVFRLLDTAGILSILLPKRLPDQKPGLGNHKPDKDLNAES